MPPPEKGPTLAGSLRIFTARGISVYVHWSWLLVGYLEIQFRTRQYDSQVWNIAEYLSLFLIVLLHEFGHALACRQVGGTADEIILWPLGGIAFVSPPPRPGAWLWSIAAGPLVNVVLVPITIGALIYAHSQGLHDDDRGAGHFVFSIALINFGLLIFNILPIYPLDGGQIFQALLWFVIGRAKSLWFVCFVGLVITVGVVGVALFYQEWWIGILAAFAAYRCWTGFQQARMLAFLESAPRHRKPSCPSCAAHPLVGEFWQCDQCGMRFDTFMQQAECPACHKEFSTTGCPECGRAHPIWAWYGLEGKPADAEGDGFVPKEDGPPPASL